MSPNLFCIFDGQHMKLADCRLNVFDLGYHRAYAVFDFCRSMNGNIRFLEDHLERFANSIQLSKIYSPYTLKDIKGFLSVLQDSNKINNGAFKLILSAGPSNDGASVNELNSNLVILNSPFVPLPPIYLKEGISLISKKHQRETPLIKSTNYFFALQHRNEMKAKGALDILYFGDYIYETSRTNIFFVKDSKIYTPAEGMLPGVTRKNLIRLYPEIIEDNIPFEFIRTCDEVFISSSSKDLLPVVRIDDFTIGKGRVGPIYKQLYASFLNSI